MGNFVVFLQLQGNFEVSNFDNIITREKENWNLTIPARKLNIFENDYN